MNKLIDIQSLAFEQNLDIIILNESWLKDFVPNKFILDKYTIYRKDRDKIRGGGVIIAIKDTYKSMCLETDYTYEDIFVEIFITKYKILLITLYRSPKIQINFDEYFDKRFSQIDYTYYDLILFTGDLNIKYELDNSKFTQIFLDTKDTFLNHGLTQIITKPTFPAINPKSILDLVFTNDIKFIRKVQIIENINDKCDHLSILIE